MTETPTIPTTSAPTSLGESSLLERIAHKLGYPTGKLDELPAAEKPADDAKPDDETVTMLYEGLQVQLAAQDQVASTLDTKANAVLVSGSLLTAAAATVQAISLQHSSSPWVPVAHTVAVAAVLLYIGVVYASLQAYALRKYQGVPGPKVARTYLFRDPLFVKRRLLAAAADAYNVNEMTLAYKAWWARVALFSLLLEGLFLALSAFIQIFI